MKRFLISLIMAALILTPVTSHGAERVTEVPSDSHEKAPVVHVFQLEGSTDRFILLDDTDDGFFVLSAKYYTRRAMTLDNMPGPFDPENENHLAYWLNNTFLTNTTLANRLPQVIIDNLVEHTYVTEGGPSGTSWSKDYETTCKVVLLSQTEWLKYNGKFGYADDASYPYWYLRTVRSNGNPLVACASAPNTGLTGDAGWNSSSGVRPAFYLPGDFFNRVKVDVSKTGDNVLAAIRRHEDKAALGALYAAKDIVLLSEEPLAPEAVDVSVIGRAIVGETITGSYKLSSLDSLPENGTTISWQKSKTKKNDSWITVLGADSLKYTPTENDVGYYLRMCVTPANTSVVGATAKSPALSIPVRPVSKPVAENIRILGIPAPGRQLEAVYHYTDENNDKCSRTTYVWEVSADGINFVPIGAGRGTGRYLNVTGSESGKYLRVGIAPIKKAGDTDRTAVQGFVTYSDSIQVGNLPEITDVTIGGSLTSVTLTKSESSLALQGVVGSLTAAQSGSVGSNYIAAAETLGGADYDTHCVWQISDTENGEYLDVARDTISYTAGGETAGKWLRAYVYPSDSKGKAGVGTASAPIYINGKTDDVVPDGAADSITFTAEAGRSYQLWISNTGSDCSYAYSMNVSAPGGFTISSDTYIIGRNVGQTGETVTVTGTHTGNAYARAKSFFAGVITATSDGRITISKAVTCGIGSKGEVLPAAAANIKVIEQ